MNLETPGSQMRGWEMSTALRPRPSAADRGREKVSSAHGRVGMRKHLRGGKRAIERQMQRAKEKKRKAKWNLYFTQTVWPNLHVCLSICLSVCLSVCPSVRPSVFHLSVYLPACLLACVSFYLTVSLSMYESAHMSARLSTCQSIVVYSTFGIFLSHMRTYSYMRVAQSHT